MSVSLHPTEKAKNYLTVIGVGLSLIASVYAGVKVVTNDWAEVVTKDKLIEHDLSKEAHSPLRDSVRECSKKAEEAIKRVEALKKDQVMAMARLIRFVAADMESDRRKKARAANVAEAAFRRFVLSEDNLELAFMNALTESRSGRSYLP